MNTLPPSLAPFGDIFNVLNVALQNRGGTVKFETAQKATAWRHRANRARKKWREALADFRYEGFSLVITKEDPLSVSFNFRTDGVNYIPPENTVTNEERIVEDLRVDIGKFKLRRKE